MRIGAHVSSSGGISRAIGRGVAIGCESLQVITHNPRTMQAADAVYGVTMQEPGVSTIVGVRLGEQAVRP